MRIGLGLLLALCFGCQDLEPPFIRKDTPQEPPRAKAAQKLEPTPAAARPPAPPPAETGPLPWIHDDYAAALTAATARDQPMVIDMWAPWCHTCLSMKQTVLADPTLSQVADRFVWLSIDTDKRQNAAVLERFPVAMWPTFYVVSPKTQKVQARHLGAASLAQFRRFLSAGERGHLAARESAGTLEKGSPLFHVRQGDRAAAAGDEKAAAAAYGKALAIAGPDWPRRPEVLTMRIAALARAEAWKPCAKLAESALANTGRAASVADFCYWAHRCASHLDDKDRARKLSRRLARRIGEVLRDPEAALSIDDRSEALRIQRKIFVDLGEKEVAKKVARAQQTLLDLAAARAKTPLEAMTYNNHRVGVYLFLDEGEKLVPKLEALVEKLPDAYDPPYRLAQLYAGLGRTDEALAMAERALKLAYGPRSAGIARFIADLHKKRGDREAEMQARKRVVEIYASLPPGLGDADDLEKARAALAALTRPD